MAKLLYICASPLEDLSFSKAVADAFVDEYQKQNPSDKIDRMELFKADLPDFDLAAASAKYKIMHQLDHSAQEKQTWANIEKVIDHFKSFDKYLFAVPMWNFSIPYRLKQYIDILVQPGHTFTIDQQGSYKGLVTGKKAIVAYAAGGDYSSEQTKSFDFQKPYMDLFFGFIGITDVQKLICEPTLQQGPEAAKNKKAQVIEKAKKLAGSF